LFRNLESPDVTAKSSHSDALNDRHLDISKMPAGSIEPERSPPSAASDIGGEEKDGFRDLLRLRCPSLLRSACDDGRVEKPDFHTSGEKQAVVRVYFGW
jgi:hypothetical protein